MSEMPIINEYLPSDKQDVDSSWWGEHTEEQIKEWLLVRRAAILEILSKKKNKKD